MTLRAQSALDGFDPNANGAIRVIVVQPQDGKILIGGEFTTLAPNGGPIVTRNHIARLNPDGTLDAAFDPNANGAVYAIALQADGKILVGGNFSGPNSIGGQTRNFIARLDPTTGATDSFDPNAGKCSPGSWRYRVTARSSPAVYSTEPTALVVKRATSSRDSMLKPGQPIRSIRTRTVT